MKHRASPRFWTCYRHLPEDVRRLADDSYQLLRRDPKHPSLHFKKVGRFWSVRVGLHYRALAVEHEDSVIWFWVGHHAMYTRLVAADQTGLECIKTARQCRFEQFPGQSFRLLVSSGGKLAQKSISSTGHRG